MKELSIEQKLRDIEVVKQMIADGHISQDVAEKYFPELKEDDDELTWLKNYISEEGYYLSMDIRDDVDRIKLQKLQKSLAWLEKMGEHLKFCKTIQIGDSVTRNEDGVLVNMSQLDRIAKPRKKQVEQRLIEKYGITGIKSKHAEGKLGEMIKKTESADKTEPKFKVGDWITDGNITIQIEAIKNDCYLYCGDCALYSIKNADKVYHLWTINDAKDGDVLLSPSTPEGDKECPFIFKEIDKNGIVRFHAALLQSEELEIADGITNVMGYANAGYHTPATKEQRDTLMKAMTDVGYIWDSEKKQCEQKPVEWSEDDFDYVMYI